MESLNDSSSIKQDIKTHLNDGLSELLIGLILLWAVFVNSFQSKSLSASSYFLIGVLSISFLVRIIRKKYFYPKTGYTEQNNLIEFPTPIFLLKIFSPGLVKFINTVLLVLMVCILSGLFLAQFLYLGNEIGPPQFLLYPFIFVNVAVFCFFCRKTGKKYLYIAALAGVLLSIIAVNHFMPDVNSSVKSLMAILGSQFSIIGFSRLFLFLKKHYFHKKEAAVPSNL